MRRGGDFTFPEAPDRDATTARTFWLDHLDPAVVLVDAIPALRSAPDALDIRTTGVEAVLLAVDGAGEQLLLREGTRHIRLALREGSLAHGPVRLRYALEGLAALEPKLLTLRRLAALWRLGHMPAGLFAGDRRAARWIALLRTLDGLEAGASQRDIAEILFGPDRVRSDWRAASDYLRLRVQRLVRNGLALTAGGYLELLSAPEPEAGEGREL